MQKLPIGIQEFSEVRKLNCLYIDKTQLIYDLVNDSKYYFFSRPRRFGKSLLLNTLKEIFLGNQHFFKGLWIENQISWESYPIVKIDFSIMGYQDNSLNHSLKYTLRKQAQQHDIALVEEVPKVMFADLIEKLHQKYNKQVVLLIDEYDKPIVDYLEDLPQAEANRDDLKNFYGAIKGSDSYLRFVFLTGVSKFAKVGIFSDLNNLKDISNIPQFATLLGYTQAELEHYFVDYLQFFSEKQKITTEALLAKIKERYNGYAWKVGNTVYNPFSILSFFGSGNFDNFWFSTGTPTFLTKMLKQSYHYELKNLVVSQDSFDTSNLRNLDYVAVLFQTGYLTHKEYLGNEMYSLDFPNTEVRDSFNRFLLAEYANQPAARMQALIYQVFKGFDSGNLEEVRQILNSLLASIPADYFVQNREKYYHAIVYLTFRLLGFFTQIELHSGLGKLDCLVWIHDAIYLFEFKLDKSTKEALAQIKAKNYHVSYLAEGKTIYLVGANMVSKKKEIEEFLVEKL